MKSVLIAAPLVLVANLAFAGSVGPTTVTKTDPTLFLGLSWTFGQGLSSQGGSSGVTLKALSTNKRNAGAVAAGLTYNFDGSIGCDLGLAYNGSGRETLALGYDLCKRAPQISVGASGLPKTTTVTPPPPD